MRCLPALLFLALTGCSGNPEPNVDDSDQQTPGTSLPQAVSQVAFQLDERDLVPEGIAYDPVGGDLYLGSIRKSKILRLSSGGEVETFVPSGMGGLSGVLGLRVDPQRRILWAASFQGASVEGFDPATPGETGAYAFSLDDGSLLQSHVIEMMDENHLFNDMDSLAEERPLGT